MLKQIEINRYGKEIYRTKRFGSLSISKRLSRLSWNIFESMSYEFKKILGDQFIRSIDSIGANIAEGYGRYHFLDKVRFYYISRASMNEAIIHWSELLLERKAINKEQFDALKDIANKLEIKLKNFISVTIKNTKR